MTIIIKKGDSTEKKESLNKRKKEQLNGKKNSGFMWNIKRSFQQDPVKLIRKIRERMELIY